MPQLRLKRFDMSTIKTDAVVVILGKRRTGKSFLTRDLLSHISDVPAGVVISGTEASNGFFGAIFPPVFIYDGYSPKIIENLVRRQKAAVARSKKDRSIDPRCLLVMDDCLYDKTWVNDENMRQIFMNGRHLGIGLIITSQYPLGIPPNFRSNIDYVFILRENIVANRRRIYDNYCGVLPTFDAFCSVLDQTTENHECLVVDNCSTSNKMEEILFYYKAEEPAYFTIGSKELWEASNSYFREDCDDEDEPLDARRKGGMGIVVKKEGP